MKKVFRYILSGLMILATIAMIVILVQDMGSVKALIYIGIALAATVITVGLFFYNLETDKIGSFIAKNKKTCIYGLTVIGGAAIFAFLYYIEPVAAFLEVDVPTALLEGKDLFGYYTAQLSLTFISISVMSVLSDKSVIIYWANISEDRLIKPTFSCFAAYTYYSIGATVGAGLGVYLNNALIFETFFILNIVFIVLLTVTMVDVYYERDIKKDLMRWKLDRDFGHYRKVKNSEGEPPSWAIRGSERYKDKMAMLRQNIYRTDANNELVELTEIYKLYATEYDSFYSRVGDSAVSAMVSTVSEKTFPAFFDSMEILVGNLYSQTDKKIEDLLCGKEVYNRYYPDVDAPMWSAMCKNPYFGQWIASRDMANEEVWELVSFFNTYKRRLVTLYNEEVISYFTESENMGDKDPADYLVSMDEEGNVYLRDRREEKIKLPRERLAEVFNNRFGDLVVEGTFMVSMLRLALLFCRDETVAEGTAARFDDFPFVELFLDNLPTLGINDEDGALLTARFRR